MRIKVEKSSKVVFRGEAPCQCKLEINHHCSCWLCWEQLQVSADVALVVVHLNDHTL